MKEDVRQKKIKTSEGRRPMICCEREVAQSIKLVETNYFETMQEERNAEKESSSKDRIFFFVRL